MEIVLMRVDERLIHSEFISKCCGSLHPDHLLVVDEELIENVFKTNLFRAILPLWLDMDVLSPKDAAQYIIENQESKGKLIILAREPRAFVELMDAGVRFTEVTFAEKAYFPNKINIPLKHQPYIARLKEAGVSLVAVSNPNEKSYPV